MDSNPHPSLTIRPRLDTVNTNRRALWIGRACVGLITLAMLGLLGRVVQLQIKPPAPIVEQIDSQRSRVTVQGRRGTVLDRQGRALAITRVAKRLFVDPKIIENPNTFSEQVGYRLGYDPASIEKKIGQARNPRYVVIDPHLTDQKLQKLDGFHLRGLGIEPRMVREYPQQSLAGQVVGFVSADNQGIEGIERVLNAKLLSQPGHMGYLRDAQRRPLWIEQADYQAPTDGDPLRLSLDVAIQAIAEAALKDACTQYRAKSGQLIVMDPYTGEVLAMANYPSFDPNQFGKSMPDDRRNRCVTDLFEPGSTFKPFVWSAITEAKLARPDQKLDCTEEGVYVTAGGRRLHDVHGHGRITWDQVLVYSSNIGMSIMAQKMKSREMHDAVRSFGFGQSTHSGLPGEVSGKITPLKSWGHYTLTSVPMGQEIAVTALQLVRGYCTFANGGYRVTPTILAVTDNADTQYQRVLSPAIAAHTAQVLRRVVVEGTGQKANSPMYPIFGKTGTAQLADRARGGYMDGQYVSSFVGGAPLDAPRLVVGCIIQQPDKSIGHYGGIIAAPAVRRVIEQSLIYIGVPPRPDQGGQGDFKLVYN